MDIEKIKQDWKERGFSCDIFTDPPEQKWDNFTHDSDELFMVLEGEVELEMNKKVLHLKIGEEIFIPTGTLHSVRNIGMTKSRWLYGYN